MRIDADAYWGRSLLYVLQLDAGRIQESILRSQLLFDALMECIENHFPRDFILWGIFLRFVKREHAGAESLQETKLYRTKNTRDKEHLTG